VKKRWKIAVGILVAVLVLAVVGVGMVAADDPNEAEPVASPVRPQRNPRGGAGLPKMKEVAELLEMTPRELLQELGEGKSIADLAQENGVEVEAIVEAMTAQGEARNAENAELVEQGLLTDEQVGARNRRAGQRAKDIVALPLPYGLQGEALRTAADAIGIPVEDLIAEIEAGKTIAEVAEANDVDPEMVVKALVAAKELSLQEMVDLDLMTKTQANIALYRYRSLAERLVTTGYHHECPSPSHRFAQGIAGAARRGQGSQEPRFKSPGLQGPRFGFGR